MIPLAEIKVDRSNWPALVVGDLMVTIGVFVCFKLVGDLPQRLGGPSPHTVFSLSAETLSSVSH